MVLLILSTAEVYPKVYHTCFFIVTYFAPLCLMVLAYIQICHKLWFQQVCSPESFMFFSVLSYSFKINFRQPSTDVPLASLHCLMYVHIESTDSWKHISVAEEVEVHAVLSSDSGRTGRACSGQDYHCLCWDQTGQSPAQDGSYADGGSLCFCPLLPANQCAQRHEKVITLRLLLQLSKAFWERSTIGTVIRKGSCSCFLYVTSSTRQVVFHNDAI